MQIPSQHDADKTYERIHNLVNHYRSAGLAVTLTQRRDLLDPLNTVAIDVSVSRTMGMTVRGVEDVVDALMSCVDAVGLPQLQAVSGEDLAAEQPRRPEPVEEDEEPERAGNIETVDDAHLLRIRTAKTLKYFCGNCEQVTWRGDRNEIPPNGCPLCRDSIMLAGLSPA